MSATIEEVGSDHSHSEHGHEHGHDHHGHDHDHDHEHDHDLGDSSLDKIQSRAERKARKALLGMGLKRVPDINRVTLRRSKTVLLVVAQPDVYKSASSDCYIVFGEAKVDDAGGQASLGAHLAQQNAAPQANDAEDDDDVPALEAVEDEDENAPVDETGIDAREIEMVMSQCNCSRAKAVRVLREHNGDVVNAIMAASS